MRSAPVVALEPSRPVTLRTVLGRRRLRGPLPRRTSDAPAPPSLRRVDPHPAYTERRLPSAERRAAERVLERSRRLRSVALFFAIVASLSLLFGVSASLLLGLRG